MPSESFIARGGSDAAYEIYKALYASGRKEPRDFRFKPSASSAAPFVGIRLGEGSETDRLLAKAENPMVGRIEFISEAAALSDGRGALRRALGG